MNMEIGRGFVDTVTLEASPWYTSRPTVPKLEIVGSADFCRHERKAWAGWTRIYPGINFWQFTEFPNERSCFLESLVG